MPGTAARARLGTAHGDGEPGRTRAPAQSPRSQIDRIFSNYFFFPFLFSSVFFFFFSVGRAGQLFPRFPPPLPALALSAVALGSDNFISQQLQNKKLFSKEISRSAHPPRGLWVRAFLLFVGFFPPLKYINLVFYFAIKVLGGKKNQTKNPSKNQKPTKTQNTLKGFCAFKQHCPDSNFIYSEAFIFAIAQSPGEL